MSKPTNLPDRATVSRIISEEAARMGVTAEAVIHRSRDHKAMTARHMAIIRIREETGCSERGLAAAWGISDATVRNAYTTPPSGTQSATEAAEQRLRWLYGPDHKLLRAGLTVADIAAWGRLGQRGAA